MTTVELPDGPTAPALVQGCQLWANRYEYTRRWRDRYGPTFTVRLPWFGTVVVISDPDDVKAVFAASTDHFVQHPNFSRFFGPDSLPVLTGDKHRRHRRLLAPPFHRRRLEVYESLVEEEAVHEMATWPTGRGFTTLPSMKRITLNVILRAVFGAEGAELDELRELLPRMAFLGSALFSLSAPRGPLSRASWAPFRIYRRRYDTIIDRLVERALADQRRGDRDDILALMLRARYDDGSAMTRGEIADELLSLLGAGHETTATTLAWTVERLRRHPEVLRRLVAEGDAGGSQLREATILEVQRVRPVIDMLVRSIDAESMQIGSWALPRGQTIIVNIQLVHESEELFPNAHKFDPDRFVGERPDSCNWIPFGGGPRRCIGAAFATMEMNLVLRTLLRHFTLEPTAAPDERVHFRGVACAPAEKGFAVVHRRGPRPAASDGTHTGRVLA
ncbi:cytochrome P450 [Nocardia sp. CDC159]|uniref:Cytochrome P450 n=1 Tax=Nocardia pulmonis TaxID=2951408 RepID=A0A9X2E8P9_9NOCA|nr:MULTISPECIES: cytochrome P450 [Nocardia]MCM6776367.1 cytochrome P450 [Nocardia pulmonis]MCM6788791.1 cytochrome P450 [Nocardia sp. CDC159]